MKINNSFTKVLGTTYPIVMAPMFLVSNEEMMKAAIRSGTMGVFPTLNFRKEGELESVLQRLNKYKPEQSRLKGNYGVNLIVQKTNPLYEKHLEICVRNKVPFYISSLGNPKKVVDEAHKYGAKVFCDVTNVEHARKSSDNGCDGFIAVGQGAGGHAGPYPLSILIPTLHHQFPGKPIIAAGGIATGEAIISMLVLGAAGVSIGTRFIASTEATVSEQYKNAVVESDMEDIVLSERISGTPCTIINTPYAKKIGYTQNWFEKFMSRNPRTKKYFKMLVQIRGMKKLELAVKPGNHDNLWCAGQSVEMIHDIISCEEIIQRLVKEMEESYSELDKSIASGQ
ncbi:MAG: NAD(P)H-dependent flavin oxidoreductase [Bacteroidia bacterium]